MEIHKLGTLEPVGVREIWEREERDFTPWLADNLQSLRPALDMQLELELVQREARLAVAGRVDILAREVNSKVPVVIENQLTWSDDGHLNRLMGYAADCKAKVLIWIATGFDPRHLNILNWLNNSGVAVYGLQLSAYRIGDTYAPWFDKLAGPEDPGNVETSVPARVPTQNLWGQFYRPLTERLKSAGIFSMGGNQGGYAGKWRKLRSGLSDAGVFYSLQLGRGEERCEAHLLIFGDAQQDLYEGLKQSQEEVEREFPGHNLEWWIQGDQSGITVPTDGLSDETDPGLLEEKRKWMFDNLVALRDAVQPRLEQVIASLSSGN